jgi:hypothetical protein
MGRSPFGDVAQGLLQPSGFCLGHDVFCARPCPILLVRSSFQRCREGLEHTVRLSHVESVLSAAFA